MLRAITLPQKSSLLLVLLATATSASLAAGISASATLTDTQPSPGVYNYAMTLNNTGTTTIGTFWFAWVPGDGFLTVTPSSISSPAGWTERTTSSGTALQWTSTSSLLAAGQSLSGFNFTSTETPSELLGTVLPPSPVVGAPDLTSFVYIGAPFADPGLQFVVGAPQAAAVTPEPGSLLLTLTGFGMAAATSLRARFRRKP